MSKPGKVLKKICKRLGVRLTIKRGKKRVYKSIKVLKEQCNRKQKKKKHKVKKKRKVKRKKKKVLKKRKFGTKSDNIKNDWLAPGQIPTDIKVVVKCPPKNIKFYIHYRKKKLSEEENMATLWIDEPVVFSGTVSDCRMDQNGVILKFKITECPEQPILEGDTVYIYSERDQISLFPIGNFISIRRLEQYKRGFEKIYYKEELVDYIKLMTGKYEKNQQKNNELFLDKLSKAIPYTTDETRLKKQSIKFHPFLTESEKEYFLEEIRRNYSLYDSTTPSIRIELFIRILNNMYSVESERRGDIVKWVINRNIDKNYKDELYQYWFLVFQKKNKEKFIKGLSSFLKKNNWNVRIKDLSNWNMNQVWGNRPELFDDNFKEFNLSKVICKNCEWNGLNLIGANLKGANLERTQFRQVKLQNAKLENAILRKARFYESKLIGANLKGANLENTYFEKTNLSRANLQGAKLSEALFLPGNDLSYINLENAILVSAVLLGANLTQANLKEAYLYRTKLRKVNLIKANLEKAILEEANLKEADLHYANLKGTNLEGANLERAGLYDAKLGKANLIKANLKGANLTQANLNGAILTKAKLTQANLTGANLSGANLKWADLALVSSGKIRGLPREMPKYYAIRNGYIIGPVVDLKGADLRRADLSGANLEGAILEEADLHYANLKGANLEGANLERAGLYDAKLGKAILIKANLKGAPLVRANLEGANLQEADLQESDLRKTNLKNADLRGADLRSTWLEETKLQGAIYNDEPVTIDGVKYEKTKFPKFFNLESSGMVKKNSSFGKKRKRKKVKRKRKKVKRKQKKVKRKRKPVKRKRKKK